MERLEAAVAGHSQLCQNEPLDRKRRQLTYIAVLNTLDRHLQTIHHNPTQSTNAEDQATTDKVYNKTNQLDRKEPIKNDTATHPSKQGQGVPTEQTTTTTTPSRTEGKSDTAYVPGNKIRNKTTQTTPTQYNDSVTSQADLRQVLDFTFVH